MKYKYAKDRWITDELDYVVQQLEKMQCVGIFQGASELGPRALGNRSLLFNPLNFNANKSHILLYRNFFL
jgi:predicted NodU family carbamoyl transferase